MAKLPLQYCMFTCFISSDSLSSCLNFASAMFCTKSNSLMGFLLLFYFSFTICFSSGADTLSADQSLSGDQTIISKGESFVVGFFKPGDSSNYYIGIWYKKVSSNPPTVVWVANRETPISDRFKSQLKILDGNLVLLNESNFQIWSTNVTTATNSNSTIAVIRDDGNLVLRDRLNSVEAVWQSFDHPTDTWLPGAKLGYDHRTKKSQLLTSWKRKVNPAEGLFSMEFEPSQKQYIFKWNRSKQYWTSGSWNGRVFSQIPEMRLNHIYNFSFFSNENESYFTYSVYNPSIISRFVVDVSGQVQQQTWLDKQWRMFSSQPWYVFWPQPKIQCEVYGFCGAFGTCSLTRLPICSCLSGFKPRSESDWNQSEFSEGCVRKTDLQCGRNVENPDFLMITVKSLPENNFVAVGSAGECRTNCLNNCSCNAYSFVDDKCSVWDGDLFNLSEDNTNGKEIYVKVASKDLPRRKKSNRVTLSTVIGSVAGVFFVLGLILLIIYRKKRRLAVKISMEGLLVAFKYKDLQIATKNFSDKLGGGGFGSVFKGVLRDSSVVAVKKLESISQGEKQFRSEVSTIGTTQHVHLVSLRGFCAEGNSKLLVYDYMPNGSLDSHLFHEKSVLNWKTRYQIALGTARGLVYLHDECRDCIIHCDIKPENILLDDDFCPKIADFGLAKLVGRDFSRVLTTIRGTRGYLAPEWLSGVAITTKADVFSYGMLLFELVSGKRSTDGSVDSTRTFFPCLVASILMAGGDILSLLDSRLIREASAEEVSKICKVAFWCIQDEEDSRPSMSVVEQILEGVLDVNIPPVPRSVQLFVGNTEPIVFFTESSSQASDC
ncbi:G-type lectin S-receptor-like serine/threonine-protein kinase At2g19130 [Cynara cardunculus var. scolymus]|uniref:G-type lectin S-receptor-like serine/threonine-protein kinase At2g19130 n=1 Tax=Cynara cardunculus var. scolymus TaxID=59895 RepID=UPI000D6256F1|nr:G-type lectin S-receptor-like serine/threonine-protein kinase At2g19130 [Cynara cardunculus var. scolymus]